MQHIGSRTIDLIKWKGLINRLDFKTPDDYDHVCARCAYGKSY